MYPILIALELNILKKVKEIKKIIGNKTIVTNIDIVQAHDSIMWGYVCTGFVDFKLKEKSFFRMHKFFIS